MSELCLTEHKTPLFIYPRTSPILSFTSVESDTYLALAAITNFLPINLATEVFAFATRANSLLLEFSFNAAPHCLCYHSGE